MLVILALVVAELQRQMMTYQLLFQAHKPNSIPLGHLLALISAIQANLNSHLNNNIRRILSKEPRNGNQAFRVLLLKCIRPKARRRLNFRDMDTVERHRTVKRLPSLMDMVLHRPSRTMVGRIDDEGGLCARLIGSSAAGVFPTIRE